MPLVPVTITLVRYSRRESDELLERFVFGGHYSGRRPPRGIDPEFVSYWIRENVKREASPMAIMRVAHLLRFYERNDILDHVSRFLSRSDATEPGFGRNAYVLQCIGEVGSPEQKRFAGGLFSELLIPHPFAMPMFPLLLETAESLSGSIDTTSIGRLMQRELEAAGKAPDLRGPEGLKWRKYSDYNRNQLPQALANIAARQRLMITDPALRLQELVVIYLGESPVSTYSMEIWAGRLLREYAMQDHQEDVLNTFGRIVDGTLKSEMAKNKKDFLIFRSSQAILYLKGKLTFPQEAAFEAITEGPESFLWDDPDGQAYPA